MFRLASSLREEEFSVCEPYEVISIRVMLYLATKAEAFERLNFMVVYGLWAVLIRSKYHGPKSLLRKMILNKKTLQWFSNPGPLSFQGALPQDCIIL